MIKAFRLALLAGSLLLGAAGHAAADCSYWYYCFDWSTIFWEEGGGDGW